MPTRPRKQPPGDKRPINRRVSGAIDQGTPPMAYDPAGRVLGTTIRSVKGRQDPRWSTTRDRDAKCRQLLAGQMGHVMPEGFALADADAFAADLPATYTRAIELLSLLQQKRCSIKRYQTTASQRSADVATTLEQILDTVMEEYPWFASCDVVMNSGLAVMITQPMPTFWEQCPTFREAPKDGEDRGEIKRRYQRDGKGRTPYQAGKGFRPHQGESVRAYEAEKADWLANHLPIMFRCFGPQEATPILGPGYKKGEARVDAVIVSTTYQRTSEISRTFIWGEDAHLSPTGSESDTGAPTSPGAVGEVEVLEYWGTDADGKVYVAYCVEGAATYYRDSGEPAVVDLSPWCSRLPVSVKWGQHWETPDPDQRALPFSWPFFQSSRQANAIATGIAVALWWAGFPTYVTTPDPRLPGVAWTAGDQPRSVEIEPLKVIEVPGPVTRLSGGEVSRDAYQMLQLLLGENEKAAPSEGATGGGDSSGFEKTIARAYAEDAQFQIMEGIRGLYEDAASFALEILSNHGRLEDGRPVPVWYAGPVLSTSDEDATSTRVLLELDPDMAGDQWAVKAEYPPSMSLAERQQSAELVERRLKTRRKHFEDDGDAAPDRTAAEIEAEDLVASPLGQEQRWDLIAKILGDDQMAEKLKLIKQQRISQGANLPFTLAQGFEDILAKRAAEEAGPNGGMSMPMPGPPPGMVPAGMPMAAPPGAGSVAPLGVPPGGQMTGLGGPTTAQSSLAGAVGGQMQAGPINRAAAAGGVIPPDLNGG